jgi:predicted nucleotidyltransferase
MKRDEVLRLLEAHRDELAQFDVRSLALFGSVARDEAASGSDVDFLVEFEGAATFDRYVELIAYLESLLGCSVDLITRRSLPSCLRTSVEQDLRYVPGLSAVPR